MKHELCWCHNISSSYTLCVTVNHLIINARMPSISLPWIMPNPNAWYGWVRWLTTVTGNSSCNNKPKTSLFRIVHVFYCIIKERGRDCCKCTWNRFLGTCYICYKKKQKNKKQLTERVRFFSRQMQMAVELLSNIVFCVNFLLSQCWDM